MSAFLGLTDAVLAALLANPSLAGGRVRRGRQLPVAASEASGISVNVLRSLGRPATLGGSTLHWETTVGIVVGARAIVGQDAEQAVDALLVAVYSRLSAAAPPSGVITWELDPAIDWDVAEADTPLAQAGMVLRVKHYTTTALAAAA